MGTIADRVHMSAYLSGGKRRVARCDEKVGCVIRRCSTRLYRASLNVGEDGEAQDDDGW